jgi:hypothetical protein
MVRRYPSLYPSLRCDFLINSASVRFVHRDTMELESDGTYLDQVEEIR